MRVVFKFECVPCGVADLLYTIAATCGDISFTIHNKFNKVSDMGISVRVAWDVVLTLAERSL